MPRLIVPSSGGGRKLIRTLRAAPALALGDGAGFGDVVAEGDIIEVGDGESVSDGDVVGEGDAVDDGVSRAFARLTTPKSKTSKCGRDELRLVPK